MSILTISLILLLSGLVLEFLPNIVNIVTFVENVFVVIPSVASSLFFGLPSYYVFCFSMLIQFLIIFIIIKFVSLFL